MNENLLKKLSVTRSTTAVVLVAFALLAFAAGARAESRSDLFSSVGVSLTGPDGTFDRQAGAHPDLTVDFALPVDPSFMPDGSVTPGPREAIRAVDVDLPPGLVGNPAAFATCSPAQLANGHQAVPLCPVAAQVGVAYVSVAASPAPESFTVGLYNLTASPDEPASFGFNYQGVVALIDAHVRPGDYGISSGSEAISQSLPVEHVNVVLWGVPADPSHDALRQVPGFSQILPGLPWPTEAPRTPFLTNPTSCTDTPQSFTITGNTWERPGDNDTRTLTADPEGTPFIFDGCEHVPFAATMNVQPLSHVAGAPTGLDVDVTVPQSDDPDGLYSSDVRKVVTTLPLGMSVSPSSAAGLGACAPAQIGLGTNAAPTCPDSSKVGTVTIDTPLLAKPLEGDVILASQNDNPFRSLLALYIAVKGPGFYIKLPGKIDLDPVTGQLAATFDDTPQLPFSALHLQFSGGSTAPLSNPQTCGTYISHAVITPWSGTPPVAVESPMTIDEGCESPAFGPSLVAGTTNPLAGQYAPFSFTLTRADRTQFLSGISTTLPPGLLANISSVTQCGDAEATTGACPSGSLIGSTSVLSGPGALPLALKGQVYLTGPYKSPVTGQSAPFGLSIVVPTAGQAGPFDLGAVVVRAALYIDPTTTQVRVVSDPLPLIIKGIPLQLRQVNVTVDRAGFMLNPTSCVQKTVAATITGNQGATAAVSSRFAVASCAALKFKPVLSASTSAKTSRLNGASLNVKLVPPHQGPQASGGSSASEEANIAKVKVELPKALPSRLTTLQKACTASQFNANPSGCPAASTVGHVVVHTPVLKAPLMGSAYFVSHGGAAFPDLTLVLQGEGITVILVGNTRIKNGITSSTFNSLPDVPISSFELNLPQGKFSELAANGNLCSKALSIPTEFTAQNGVKTHETTKISVNGCPKAKKVKKGEKAKKRKPAKKG